MSSPARFEHIAIAVHLDDLAAWDRLLRGELGGTAGMGGEVPKIDFQGGQISYPEGGMLEILSWLPGHGAKSAMRRYVDRHGGRAALHHLTFLVEDFDAAIERSRALGQEPMLGRDSRNWREFYLREPGLRPAGFLIQVLQADKGALATLPGWGGEWAPFAACHPEGGAPVRIAGVQLASVDVDASARLFADLLGARPAESRGEAARVLLWPGSSMWVRLVESGDPGDSYVSISAPREEEAGSLPRRIQTPEPATTLLVAEA